MHLVLLEFRENILKMDELKRATRMNFLQHFSLCKIIGLDIFLYDTSGCTLCVGISNKHDNFN